MFSDWFRNFVLWIHTKKMPPIRAAKILGGKRRRPPPEAKKIGVFCQFFYTIQQKVKKNTVQNWCQSCLPYHLSSAQGPFRCTTKLPCFLVFLQYFLVFLQCFLVFTKLPNVLSGINVVLSGNSEWFSGILVLLFGITRLPKWNQKVSATKW